MTGTPVADVPVERWPFETELRDTGSRVYPNRHRENQIMNHTKPINILTNFAWMPILLAILLGTGPAHAANYPLEIIQPQPNLDTRNRFYKAYPGLEYNVRLAVIGGNYPYRYELTSAPSGMTINGRGEITWPDPQERDTPYNVSVSVSDSGSGSQTVSWTVTVTTDGFLFVDAVNGTPASQGGTGTISNPWKTMKDVYGGDDYSSKHSDHHPGAFVYWRAGTYGIDAHTEDGSGDNAGRVPWSNRKPLVWLAYPREAPQINFNLNNYKDAYIHFYGSISDLYIEGFDFNNNGNARGKSMVVSADGNTAFRRNIFRSLTNGWTGGNNSHLFYANGSGKYHAIQDNVSYGNNQVNAYWLLGYDSPWALVEDNEVSTIGAHPISPKEGNQMWFIRGNYLHDNSGNSINLQYSDSHGIQSGDIEISYNLVTSGGGKVRINSNWTSNGRPVYIFRNTFMDEVEVMKVTSTNGSFRFYHNVIVNETSYPDKIRRNGIDDPSSLIVSDNLTASWSDNIVDEEGNLTSSYSSYVGSRGHQIGHQPAAPTAVQVVPK